MTGQVLYNDQPIVKFTKASPDFWARNDDTGKEFPTDPMFDSLTGTYTIPNVPPGSYSVNVLFDAAAPFDGRPVRPGDFNGANGVIVANEGGSVVQSDLRVQQVIHLTSPVDNIDEIGQIGDPKPTYAITNLRFAWDPIAEATSYRVTIDKFQEPYEDLGTVWTIETSDIKVVSSLPRSDDNQFYKFGLLAYNSDGLLVGKLMVTYTNGHGWDYRFRIE